MSLLFVDIFDTIGTLTGVGMRAGYIGPDGELPRANKALMADAIGTTVGPLVGTSRGKAREVSLGTWIIAGIFIARFIFMTLRFGGG